MGRGDRVFAGVATALAAAVPLLLVAIVLLLMADALPAVQRYGLGFLTNSMWDPVAEKFGAAAYAYGTVVTSALALLIAGPIGVGCALFIAEYAPASVRGLVAFLVDLLATIPSVIYGLWGFFILAPVMRSGLEPFLKNTFGPLPVVGALFTGPAVGRDMLVAGVILAIMIPAHGDRGLTRGAASGARHAARGHACVGCDEMGDDQQGRAALRPRRDRRRADPRPGASAG